MDYKIKELENKVKQLRMNPTQGLAQEIESLLRDINAKKELPEQDKPDLMYVINELGHNYSNSVFGGSNVSYFVEKIAGRLLADYGSPSGNGDNGGDRPHTSLSGTANAGSTAAQGQQQLRRDVNFVNSAARILRKFGINPWRR